MRKYRRGDERHTAASVDGPTGPGAAVAIDAKAATKAMTRNLVAMNMTRDITVREERRKTSQ